MSKLILLGEDSYQTAEIVKSVGMGKDICYFNQKNDILEFRNQAMQEGLFNAKLLVLTDLIASFVDQDWQICEITTHDLIISDKDITLLNLVKEKIQAKNWEIKLVRPLSVVELNHWIENKTQQFELNLSNQHLRKLVELHGNNLYILENELIRLRHLFYQGKAPINIPSEFDLGEISIEASIFAFTDALGNRNENTIFSSLKRIKFADDWELFYLIVFHLRNMLRCAVRDTKGIHPFVVQKLNGQLRHWKRSELLQALQELLDIEYQVKCGNALLRPKLTEWFTKHVLPAEI